MNTSPKPQSPLGNELETLRRNIRRLRDCLLNRTFDLTLQGATRRQRLLSLLFFLVVAAVIVALHPQTEEWTSRIRNIFIYLLNPTMVDMQPNPIIEFFTFAFGGSWSNLLRYLPILLFPYFSAIHLASLYLADIFEKPVSIAREFIGEVALGGASETVKIREGEFQNKEESRIYAIGGPGHVEVDRNSAVLFEKPDGRPHVIGPTVDGAVLLDGFERFRAAIDLRDQHVDLRDQDNREINSRSLEGVPISATDVSMRFSIWRGAEKKRTLRDPNPFMNDLVIHDLVFGQSIAVSRDAKPKDGPVDIPSPIGPPMIGIIRGELSKFMSERKLTEYLASYGTPEVLAAQKQAEAIHEQTQKVVPPGEPTPDVPSAGTPPAFVPRPDISARFNESFAAQTHQRGVQLDWIGVGTWKTSIDAASVLNHHLDAWKLSMENASRGNDKAIEGVAKDAATQKTIHIIQEVPLARHHENLDKPDILHRQAVKRLLVGYREQMTESREILVKKNNPDDRPLVQVIDAAIDYMAELLGWKGFHYPGRDDDKGIPPTPYTRE
jgi:hypothetical protein